MLKAYYHLTKPGIIYGNAISAIAGFLLASKGHFDFNLFLATLVGLSFVIGSACVFNNIYDSEIDQKMARTRERAIASGLIAKGNAMIFGLVLLLLGVFILRFHTTMTAMWVALFGFLVYVFLYTPLKHRTVHATLVGSLAGAVPPVVGYTAVAGKIDAGAIILFFILVSWQMPHFYAIAIRRLDEYAEAHIPVLPIKKGIRTTKYYILFYIMLFILASVMLFAFHYVGYFYLVVALILGLIWLRSSIRGFKAGTDDRAWARKMFFFSLIVLLSLSIAISISGIMRI